MKKTLIISAIIAISISIISFTLSDEKTNVIKEKINITTNNINVYYFHNSRRCTTCMAVEKVTKESLNELYPEMMKNGKIIFQSIDIEQENNKSLVEKYQISGQTLLIISKSNKINLTNDAFMYARNNPEKLKSKIKITVDKIVK